MPRCDHCDGFVSERFARVFADDQGRIHACVDCTTTANIAGTVRARA